MQKMVLFSNKLYQKQTNDKFKKGGNKNKTIIGVPTLSPFLTLYV